MFKLIVEGCENPIDYNTFLSVMDRVVVDKKLLEYEIVTSDRKNMDEYAVKYASDNNQLYRIILSDKTAGASAYMTRNAEIVNTVEDVNQAYAVIGYDGKDIDTKHLLKVLKKKHISYECINF